MQLISSRSLVFTLILAASTANADCEWFSNRFTPPADAEIIAAEELIQFNELSFCQLSYQTQRSPAGLVADYKRILLRLNDTTPLVSSDGQNTKLIAQADHYNDYIEVVDLNPGAIVNISSLGPGHSDSYFSPNKDHIAGLPVISKTNFGGISSYYLETPQGLAAGQRALRAYLKNHDWIAKPTFFPFEYFTNGEAIAMIGANEETGELTLSIMEQDEERAQP